MEWRWLYLTTILKIQQEKSESNQVSSLKDTEFEKKLKLFFYDLIVTSITKFNKVLLITLLDHNEFGITCSYLPDDFFGDSI